LQQDAVSLAVLCGGLNQYQWPHLQPIMQVH
jgi:hypothetical protein